MPTVKPSSLSRRHSTKEEIAARTESEAAMTPVTELTVTPPPKLHGHKAASSAWTYYIKLYSETKGTIITAFDSSLLVILCLLEEECEWIEEKRSETEKREQTLGKQIDRMKPKGDEMKTYVNLLKQFNALSARVGGWDARLDGKRKLLHSIAQSLYLTPRSRAGAAPKSKEDEPEDKMKDFD